MTVALSALPQFFDNSGNPVSGGKLFTYAAGTLTPLSTYTDRGGLTANANPVVLDSAGRADVWLSTNVAYKLILQDAVGNTLDSVDNFYAGADPAQLVAAGIVPATGGTYTGLVSFTGGATFDGTAAQDLATLNSLGISAVMNKNLYQNSDFRYLSAAAGSYADAASMFVGTAALCDTGSVTLAQVSQPLDGIPFASRTTQPDAAPKRIGFVQQINAANSYFYRGKSLAMSAKVRTSSATTVRMALVAWTGTADTAPVDVVNNWSSTTYTAGNFFIANTTPIAVTATAVGAATFTDLFASSSSAGGVVVPSGTNNLYMVVWTDVAVAQNFTLDASCIECDQGTSAQLWSPIDPQETGRLIGLRVITTTGAYTPSAGTNSVVVEGVGGGGGGGGVPAAGGGAQAAGGGGGAGSYGLSRIPTGFAGVTVTIGAGGTAAANAAGGNGGTSSFGSLLVLPGGGGGGLGAGVAGTSANGLPGAAGGTPTGQSFGLPGAAGGLGMTFPVVAISGAGANSRFGSGGGVAAGNATTVAAGNAGFTGAGGGGAIGINNGAAAAGGLGGAGVIVIWEYA